MIFVMINDCHNTKLTVPIVKYAKQIEYVFIIRLYRLNLAKKKYML